MTEYKVRKYQSFSADECFEGVRWKLSQAIISLESDKRRVFWVRYTFRDHTSQEVL